MTSSSNMEQQNLQQEVEDFRNQDADLKSESAPTPLPEIDSKDLRDSTDKHQQHPPLMQDSSDSEASSDMQQRQPRPYRFVPLCMDGRTHVVSPASRALMEAEVTLDDLTGMTKLFYDKAFLDPVLDKFIRTHDDQHGVRFAKWIHQKLSGSTVWDEDRQTRDLTPVQLANSIQHVIHDRSSAHAAAWYSPKRPSHEVGRHFKLDECRVWMRLHFWAMRESGIIQKSPSFADYYIRFIGHFVRVYESTAPVFARESFRWSADPNNITNYLELERRMPEIMSLTLEQAEAQIPEKEANDSVWPYNQSLA